MIPAFVIHRQECTERQSLVDELVKKTKAHIVEPVWNPSDPKQGCRQSHCLVALIARSLYPNKPYLVFEDDCVLANSWKSAIEDGFDIIYLGVNGVCEHTLFGTHALYITPKVRDAILAETEELSNRVIDKGAYDHILSLLCRLHGFKINVNTVAVQKEGLKSYITGNLRKSLRSV